jgi:hypothetical protein
MATIINTGENFEINIKHVINQIFEANTIHLEKPGKETFHQFYRRSTDFSSCFLNEKVFNFEFELRSRL